MPSFTTFWIGYYIYKPSSDLLPSILSFLMGEKLTNSLHLDSKQLLLILFIKMEGKESPVKLCFSSHLTHFIPLFSCYSRLKAQKPDNCSFLSLHVWYPSPLTVLVDYFNYFIFLWYIFWFCLVYNYMYLGSSHFYDIMALYTVFSALLSFSFSQVYCM